MKIKHLLVASCVLALPVMAIAQNANKGSNVVADNSAFQFPTYKTWSIGVGAGMLNGLADVKMNDYMPSMDEPSELGLMYHVDITKFFNPVFGLQARLGLGSTAGTSKMPLMQTSASNVYYEADVLDYSLNAIINFSNISSAFSFRPSTKQKCMLIYGVLGVGSVKYSSVLKEVGTKNVIKSEEDKSSALVNAGLGVKFRLGKSWDLGVETVLANLNTDDFDRITVGRINDRYNYTNINLAYKIGKDAEHVQWVNPVDPFFNDYNDVRKKVNGMGNDEDKDGVADMFDKDNTTPDGVKVYGDGTAVDTDHDGVADARDNEPFSRKGASVDANGVEMDADGDGVGNSADLESNTPAGNMVNFQGKTIKLTGGNSMDIAGGYFPSIYFDSGSDKIKSSNNNTIASVARVLKANPEIKLMIIGNADVRGGDAMNEKLSERRSRNIADNLVKVYGVDGNRLTIKYNGKREPLSKTDDSINRRVDFQVAK